MTTNNNAAPSGLTDEQIEHLWYTHMGHSISSGRMAEQAKEFARALLAAALKAAEQAPDGT